MINVILCSYKGEKYIEAQRKSILTQQTDKSFELHEYDDELRKSGSATLNFLNAIREVPQADYYMLSDQDDIWHRDKIQKMYEAIKKAETKHGADKPILVFSDATVIGDDLKVIHPSFVKYEGLSPKRTKLNQLLLMNQVTGAACIFNDPLRKMITSHPVPARAVVHDHWLALVASALGHIEYLDEALYDYRQHDSNVLGAKKADVALETKRRLGTENDAQAKAGYRALFDQAEEFLEQYRDQLSPEQIDAVWHFVQLPKFGKAERVTTVLKYDFLYNKFYRNVGELIFI